MTQCNSTLPKKRSSSRQLVFSGLKIQPSFSGLNFKELLLNQWRCLTVQSLQSQIKYLHLFLIERKQFFQTQIDIRTIHVFKSICWQEWPNVFVVTTNYKAKKKIIIAGSVIFLCWIFSFVVVFLFALHSAFIHIILSSNMFWEIGILLLTCNHLLSVWDNPSPQTC